MKNNKMKVLLAIIATCTTLVGCTQSQLTQTNVYNTTTTETIKIGVIAPLSGDAAAFGKEEKNILEYELNQINKEIKNTNKQFKLIYEDGKCNGNDAVTAFQKLTDINNVKVILGGFCSSETLAIAPLGNAKKILIISPFSSSPELKGISDFLFTLTYSDNISGNTIAEEMKNYKKVAIITEQTDYPIAIKNVWEEKIKNFKNVNVVANETFSSEEKNYKNLLAKIAKAQPDALFLNPNSGKNAEQLLKQIAETPTLQDVQLIGGFQYTPNTARQYAKERSENMIIIDAATPKSEKLSILQSELETASISTENGGALLVQTTTDALNIATDMILEFKTTEDMKNALRERTFNGVVNQIYFGDNTFSQNFKMTKYIVKNGIIVEQ